MSNIQATNNFVFIVRDETKDEIDGLIIPGSGQEKPNQGIIHSVGSVTTDKNIKKGKSCLFHKGVGFEIDHEDITYLVLESERIIAVI